LRKHPLSLVSLFVLDLCDRSGGQEGRQSSELCSTRTKAFFSDLHATRLCKTNDACKAQGRAAQGIRVPPCDRQSRPRVFKQWHPMATLPTRVATQRSVVAIDVGACCCCVLLPGCRPCIGPVPSACLRALCRIRQSFLGSRPTTRGLAATLSSGLVQRAAGPAPRQRPPTCRPWRVASDWDADSSFSQISERQGSTPAANFKAAPPRSSFKP
jgi:hypothetical protein